MIMRIAVLALQGAFIEHEQMLARLGVPVMEIRQRRDLDRPFDGLILPGGESTVQGRLLRLLGLYEPLKARIAAGLPVFGTCAGLLLLARTIRNDPRTHFATMHIAAVRNAYGRQLGSFTASAPFDGSGVVPMPFIRAPFIAETSGEARPLSIVDGRIAAARERNQLVTAFHPELTGDPSVHQYFLDMVRRARHR